MQRRHRHEIKVTLKPCHCGLPPAVLQVPRLDFQFEKPRVAVDQCFTNGKMVYISTVNIQALQEHRSFGKAVGLFSFGHAV